MKLSQIFCFHVEEEVSSRYLYWKREKDGGSGMFGLPTYSNYEYRAARKVCLKCGRKRIESYRVNWGRLTPRAVDCAYCHCETVTVGENETCDVCGRLHESHSR